METVECAWSQVLAEARATSGPLVVAVDVGATNMRFALTNSFTTLRFVKTKCRAVGELLQALRNIACWLKDDDESPGGVGLVARIVAAAVCLPGAVQHNNLSVISNYQGKTNTDKTVRRCDLPVTLFPSGSTSLMNDLESAAMGIAGVDKAKLMSTVFTPLWLGSATGDATSLDGACAVVVAPGTGLGTAVLRDPGGNKDFQVLPLEFGHVNLLERDAMYDARQKTIGRKNVEPDDLCSGRGLEFAFAHLSNTTGITVEEISRRAKRGDAVALAAFRSHYNYLMNVCSQMTMGFVATHVIIAGDNTVRNGFVFEQAEAVEEFRKTFLDHSMERYGFMSRATVLRQIIVVNLNLTGAAFSALQLAQSHPLSPSPKAKL